MNKFEKMQIFWDWDFSWSEMAVTELRFLKHVLGHFFLQEHGHGMFTDAIYNYISRVQCAIIQRFQVITHRLNGRVLAALCQTQNLAWSREDEQQCPLWFLVFRVWRCKERSLFASNRQAFCNSITSRVQWQQCRGQSESISNGDGRKANRGPFFKWGRGEQWWWRGKYLWEWRGRRKSPTCHWISPNIMQQLICFQIF